MNGFRKFLLPLALTVSAGAVAQGTNLPSAVDAVGPLTRPLAGTLFFDAEQRSRMNRIRERGFAIAPDAPGGVESRSMIEGFVKRSDGKATVWVDGMYKPMEDPVLLSRIQSTSVGMDTQSVFATEAAAEVKPAPIPAKVPAKKRAASRKAAADAGAIRK
jgi:hypothetical protein